MNIGEGKESVIKCSAVGGRDSDQIMSPVQCRIPMCTVQEFTLPYVSYLGSKYQSMCEIWGNLTTVTWPNLLVCGYKYEENSGHPAVVCYKSFFTILLCSCNPPIHYVVCKVVLAYFMH